MNNKRQKRTSECICPKCHKKHFRRDSGKYRFCAHCEDVIKTYGIADIKADECRVVA
jgi:ribosomal protein L37AE/L43A